MSRKHVCSLEVPVGPEELWSALVKPSAIRAWWGAARVVINPREGGTWAAAWGENEDRPDYVSAARLVAWDPPRSMRMADYEYHVEGGEPPPFTGDLETGFRVEGTASGSRLTVVQEGFPDDSEGDEFYSACETGWHQTLESLRRYLAGG